MSLLKVNEIQIFNGETVTITAPTVVTANDNTNAALRITQTGTGNALVVEDEANPDSTPFVVNSSGNVGVGTNLPGAKQEIKTATDRRLFIESADVLASGMRIESINDAGNANQGMQFNGNPFAWISNGTERMRIDSSGNVGIGTTSPSQKLDVSGNINATGALTLGTALAIAEGGTGQTSASAARIALLPTLGTAGQVLAVNTGASDVEWVDAAAGGGSGTVTSVAISGTDGIEVDSGSPITTSGTIALGINAATLSSHLSLGTAATTAATDYATAAQGTLADSAVQPADNANTLGSGAATDGYVLTADGSGGAAWEAVSGGSGISNVVEDTTPQLGGNLDVNGNSIVSTSAGNISITPDTTGKIILDGLSWPTADGTADQVIKTDGSGNLSFVDQSAGGSYGDSDVLDLFNSTGSAPVYACRAWVNFNGTFGDNSGETGSYSCSGSTITITDTSHGLSVGDSIHAFFTRSAGDTTAIADDFFVVLTVPSADTFTIQTSAATTDQSGSVSYDSNALGAAAEGPIRASGNVSSITDNGTGDYTVNFTTAMPDANYAVAGACSRLTGAGYEIFVIQGTANMTTSSVRIATRVVDQDLIDQNVVTVAIFR